MSLRLIVVMLILGVSCLLPQAGYSLVTHSLDQDLDSDILLRNRHTGAWRVFTMEGMAQVSETALGVWANPKLTLQALADFDGDGDSDVLLRNTADSGGWRLFEIENGKVVGNSGPAIWMSLKRQFVAAEDFDADGDADVLIRDMETGAYRLFFFENGVVSSSATLGIYQNLVLQFVAAGDLDGDGDADVLIRNGSGGSWRAFYLENGVVAGNKDFTLWQGSNWELQGVADYDGDGDSDVLLRHDLNGNWKLFEVELGQVVNEHTLNVWSNLAWETQAANADYDGDGDADVLLRHACNGSWRTFTVENFTIQTNGNPKMWANLDWDYQADGQIKPTFSDEPGTVLWEMPGIGPTYSAPVLGQDGTIYTVNIVDTVVASNRDGTIRWTIHTPYDQPQPVTVGEGCTIFVGYESGAVRAYGPDTAELWSFQADAAVTQPILGPDGNLYVGSSDYDHGHIYVLDQAGNLLQSYQTAGRVLHPPTVAQDGTIYFPSAYPDWKLNAMSPDGTVEWFVQFGPGGEPWTPQIGPDSNIYVIGADSLLAYTPSGGFLWQYKPENAMSGTPAIGPDGTLYVLGATGNRIYAVSSDGLLQWMKEDRRYNPPTVSPAGYVYASDGNTPGQLSVFNPDGTTAWVLPTDELNGNIPDVAFGENQTVYAPTTSGLLLSISGQ